MKTFLSLCAAVLLLTVSLPLSAAPDADRDAVLRDEMEARFQLLEDKLSLQQERRLDELKNELHKLREERKTWLDDTQNPIIATAEKKKEEVRATGDRYVSMVGTNFTALGVLAAIIALVPAIFSIANTVSFNESAKQKLNDIERIKRDVQKKREEIVKTKDETQKIGEKYIKELKFIIEKHKKTQTEWEELVKKTKRSASTLDVNSTDNILKNTKKRTIDINNAQELIKNGKGLEVLWGQAILAMSSKQWEKACSYWEDIAQQDPSDASACLNLAKCQIMWGISNNITPAQRQEHFSKAENSCQEMLQQSDELPQELIISIYLLYASLKKIQTKYTAAKYHKKLYTDAEQILLKAQALAPKDINVLVLLAQIKQEQAINSLINSGERTNLRTEAEQLLLEAKELAPQDVDILSRLAQLNLDMARDSQSAAERTNLRTKAKQLLLEAKELAPQDVDILGILAQFNLDTARDSQSVAESTNLRTKAEQILLQIQNLTDPHVSIFTMLAQLKLDLAKDSQTPEERITLRTEAERFLQNAQQLAPLNITPLLMLAQLKLDLAKDSQTAARRTNLRTETEQLLLEAKKLSPQDPDLFIIFAQLKLDKAKDEQTSSADRATLRSEAEQSLQKIKKLNPQNVKILAQLAYLKMEQINDPQTLPAERASLRTEAEKLLLHAKELSPQQASIINALVMLKLEQAREAEPEQQDSLIGEADKYLNELSPEHLTKHLYNRACIAALRGQSAKALELLEECRQAGTLPSREHIESDKDMDSLRDLDAFKKFMERAFPPRDNTKDSE